MVGASRGAPGAVPARLDGCVDSGNCAPVPNSFSVSALRPGRVRLPPGPRSALLQVPRYLRRADLYYRDCLARYGDPFTEPTLYGPQVVTGRADGARQLFALPPESFDSFLPVLGPLVGSASVLVANGTTHRRGRRLLTPAFNAARTRAMAPVVFELAEQTARSLVPGRRYEALALAQTVTLDIILRIVFGVRDPRHAAALREQVLALVDHTNAVTLVPLARDWFRRTVGTLPPWSRYLRAVEGIDALLFDILEHAADDVLPDTVLAQLIEARDDDGRPLPRQEVRDHLLTLLLAGHETTAATIAWAVYELCRHPDELARLREETRGLDPGDITRLPYANALTNEVLRLHPISSRVGRKLKRPMELCGYELPAGIAAAVCITAVHQDPALYPEPDRFRPARFLERSYDMHEHVPFGGGARRCIGAPLARLELPLIVTAFFRALDFALVDHDEVVPERRALTVGPRGRVPVEVRPLAASSA